MENEKKMEKKWVVVFWTSSLFILISDLFTKYLFFALYPPATDIHDENAFHIIHTAFNKGVAFSFLADTPYIVTILTILLIPVLCVYYWKACRLLGTWYNLAFGLIIGGAIGNAYDRFMIYFSDSIEGVRDFIHVDTGFWPLNPWPTFNIADAGISVGFAILVVLLYLLKEENKEEEK